MRNLVTFAAVAGVAALVTTSVFAAVVPPRIPRTKPGPTINVSCGTDLSYLRTVTRFEIAEIGEDRNVMIEFVCAEDRLTGNATGVRRAIEANDTLAQALDHAGTSADDVLGIRFGGQGLVLLYVAQ